MTTPPSGPASAAGPPGQEHPRGKATGKARAKRSRRDRGGAGGALGTRTRHEQTFLGRDPDAAAAAAICKVSPTRCQARTRMYRDGRLELQGFPVADISDHLADPSVTIWLDLR